MFSTVRQLPKVRVLLEPRETWKYDITLSGPFDNFAGNGAVDVEDRIGELSARG